MVPVLLAVGTAGAYGIADFFGGLASRGTSAPRVLLVAHASSIVVLAVAVGLLPASRLAPGDALWAGGGAVLGILGLTLLYRGLAGGPMAIVSSVSAVMSAVVPLVMGLATGEQLHALAWTGVVLGLAATVLVSVGPASTHESHTDPRPLTVLLAVLAGSGIGTYMAAIAQCSDGAGLRPLLVSRTVTTLLLLAASVALVRSLRPSALLPRRPGIAALAGMLDSLGTSLFLVAAMVGPLGVVAVIAAQYPAFTVLLARVRLGERLAPHQLVGLGAALTAVALLAL